MKLGLKHILVRHSYEADDILLQLSAGKNFEVLAQKFSQCSSGLSGGDLGVVSLEKLDPDFAEAAESLAVGARSAKPVRSRFGYHIILRYK
ncbi:MAG: peptidylprolyl isomerase [Bdellovibrionia bacterium]